MVKKEPQEETSPIQRENPIDAFLEWRSRKYGPVDPEEAKRLRDLYEQAQKARKEGEGKKGGERRGR